MRNDRNATISAADGVLTRHKITEAFPWDSAPRYVIRDRDSVYGALVRARIKAMGILVRARIKAMGIEEVVTAPRSPWQNPFVERVTGSKRRAPEVSCFFTTADNNELAPVARSVPVPGKHGFVGSIAA